ncbi:hypothetical protein H4R22_004381, partial [Coemansia sp. RSA 1290]
CVNIAEDKDMAGEFMVVEDAGISIDGYFKCSGFDEGVAIGASADYVHTLLVAATGDGSLLSLHRDVSVGNLM